MDSSHQYLPHYTIEDWVHWEGSWELINGHPIAMSPSPIPKHQRIAAELRTELVLALRESGCKNCRAYDPVDYVLANDTILVPDILVVCGDITKKYLDFPPRLVVEILSPSTVLRDRNTKYHLYEAEGIPYYLIVDPEGETIEIFKLTNGAYQPLSASDTYTFELNDTCSITPHFLSVFEN